MTINWFSPFALAQPPIGVDTMALLPALAERASITVWIQGPDWPPALEQSAEVRQYDPSTMPWAEVNSADATVYHLGNHLAADRPIWEVSRQHPGIVVLQDLNMQDFFAAWAMCTSAAGQKEYLEMMEFHHLQEGRALGEAFLAGTATIEEVRAKCPLTGAAIENALGVVVHTEEGYSRLAPSCDVPIAHLVPGEAYVDGLMHLIDQTIAARSREALRWVAGRAGYSMKPWFTHKADRVLLPRLARAISSLLDERISSR